MTDAEDLLKEIKKGLVIKRNKKRKINERRKNMENKQENFEEITSNIILQVGIPYNIAGSKYLSRAIQLAMEYRNVSIFVTRDIYAVIAKENKTKPANVERAIRHAINTAWSKNKIINLNIIKTERQPIDGQP